MHISFFSPSDTSRITITDRTCFLGDMDMNGLSKEAMEISCAHILLFYLRYFPYHHNCQDVFWGDMDMNGLSKEAMEISCAHILRYQMRYAKALSPVDVAGAGKQYKSCPTAPASKYFTLPYKLMSFIP